MLSTRDLSGLLDIEALRRLMQSVAMLDAILSPEWQFRYFSFNCRWAPGEQMGSMRNGQGDHYFSLFNTAGCWLKGFDHESPMSPFTNNPPKVAAGVLDGVPVAFLACLSEPAFVIEETTFCIWRRHYDQRWKSGPVAFPNGVVDPDGSERFLRWLDGRPETYQKWAEEYFEVKISLAAVKRIYAHEVLDRQMVIDLNPEPSVESLAADAEEIGYPASR